MRRRVSEQRTRVETSPIYFANCPRNSEMRVLRQLTWAKDEKAIACDFDRAGRSAVLLQAESGGLRAEIDGTTYALPPWAAHASRIRWFGNAAALLWPVDFHVGKTPRIGKIDPKGAVILDLEYPLDVFSDFDLLAFTYSEERSHTNLISLFSAPDLDGVAALTDDFVAALKTPSPRLLEVEHAVSVFCRLPCVAKPFGGEVLCIG
jgi:hypothetical protein